LARIAGVTDEIRAEHLPNRISLKNVAAKLTHGTVLTYNFLLVCGTVCVCSYFLEVGRLTMLSVPRQYSVDDKMIDGCRAFCEMRIAEVEVLEENPPVLLFPPEKSHMGRPDIETRSKIDTGCYEVQGKQVCGCAVGLWGCSLTEIVWLAHVYKHNT
jgi:hypothetical protein